MDEEPELASAFGVMSIPTLLVIQDGKIVAQSVGLKAKEQIKQMIPV
ncbi:MAG: thioredoxin family protein [Anaeromassilibacillus sp.]